LKQSHARAAFPIVEIGEKIKDVEKMLLDRADYARAHNQRESWSLESFKYKT
jgi:hypothetical protein